MRIFAYIVSCSVNFLHGELQGEMQAKVRHINVNNILTVYFTGVSHTKIYLIIRILWNVSVNYIDLAAVREPK